MSSKRNNPPNNNNKNDITPAKMSKIGSANSSPRTRSQRKAALQEVGPGASFSIDLDTVLEAEETAKESNEKAEDKSKKAPKNNPEKPGPKGHTLSTLFNGCHSSAMSINLYVRK